MDGIHDLGGRQGFGAIDVGEKEEPFHEPWEGRVRGMVNAMGRPPDWNIDWFRHCRELIDPVDYLTRPYFDQWLQSYCAMLVNSGVATVEELASGRSRGRATDVSVPMSAAAVESAQPGAARFDRERGANPRYAVGDPVRTVERGVPGHTRLPGYARGRRGVVHALHGTHVLPDSHALGGDRAEPLYTVAFDAADLWPETGASEDRVYINLWESYLADG